MNCNRDRKDPIELFTRQEVSLCKSVTEAKEPLSQTISKTKRPISCNCMGTEANDVLTRVDRKMKRIKTFIDETHVTSQAVIPLSLTSINSNSTSISRSRLHGLPSPFQTSYQNVPMRTCVTKWVSKQSHIDCTLNPTMNSNSPEVLRINQQHHKIFAMNETELNNNVHCVNQFEPEFSSEQLESLKSAEESFRFLPRTTTNKVYHELKRIKEGCQNFDREIVRHWLQRANWDFDSKKRFEKRLQKLRSCDHAVGEAEKFRAYNRRIRFAEVVEIKVFTKE